MASSAEETERLTAPHSGVEVAHAQRQEMQLMSFVVHDLKNPINTIDLHAQLLLRREELSAQARASVQLIRREARSLMRLALNLLDITANDERALGPRLDTVDLLALVGEIVDEFRGRADSRGVSIVTSLEVTSLRADADLLRRVLENLIDNALRHAPDGSRIGLGTAADAGAVLLRVADEGRGIPAELRGRIFDRFVRLETRAERHAGRGLGLEFCKLAVEAHGGSITVEDASPGAVFRIRLPQG